MLLRAGLTILLASTTAAAAEPVRLATPAFGTSAEVEVRGLPRAEAEAASRRALQVIFEISRLADPASADAGGIGELNAAAGQGPQPIAAPTAELLIRGLQICFWSNGAHGPLGGELRRLWSAAESFPDTEGLRSAVLSAACSGLSLTGGEPPRATLAEGSRIDTAWLARGFAIDQAVLRLEEDGVANAWLEIGPVSRALGAGPGDVGWQLDLPPATGSDEPADRILLVDQAAAVVRRDTADSETRIFDQRTGIAPRGVVLVAVVANQAWDAEVLAASLYVLGLRDGQMRLGGYSPRPSIFWLLGEGDGTPLQSTYRWTELRRIPRR